MARETLSVERIDTQGVTNPTYTTIGEDGVEFKNDGKVMAHIKASTATTVTVTTPATVNGDLDIDDRTYDLEADDEILVGGFSKRYYNTDEGMVEIDSDETDAEILVFKG